ncbi:Gfo/Idh/MocA family oxidoreductase [Methylobacterium sp. C25]|uniref:Gfo/Idh/MocA family protein n=1 Tax=Methylobacterium sp. C25 TaxID=2721622 RepID=UPI001F24D75C|nr:Gfo/Idh/MocA family oxidoreductase [Methylobacterium sp. C25]MCE4225047.1 Gfo/Idh/MocA family oxidoreductase [Methylobacterium sp. C25]
MVFDPVGVAVIGYGYWGPNLARNFAALDEARLVAVVDRDPLRRSAAERAHQGIRTTASASEVFSDPSIRAVAIATPTHTHYELALAALRAGKHVLVEKPLAQTSAQVAHLIEEAEQRKLVLMVDHTFLYTPAVQKIRQLIASGGLGDIYYYNSTRASLGLFQSDINVVWDLAVHDLSIIRYLLDEIPVAVSATGVSHVPGRPENMAHITLHFESRCVAHISVNWLSPVKVRQTFVGGERKMVVYNDLEATEKVKVYDRGITIANMAEPEQLRVGYRAGDMWAPHLAAKEALQTELEHFIDCIDKGEAPTTDGFSGLEVVEILEATSQSIAARGAPIPIKQRKFQLRAPAPAILREQPIEVGAVLP